MSLAQHGAHTSQDTRPPTRWNVTYIEFIITDGDDQDPVFADVTHQLWLQEENDSLIAQYFETTPPLFAYDLDFGINETIEYRIFPEGERMTSQLVLA